MSLEKNIRIGFLSLLFLFLAGNPVLAKENSYVNIVHPVRGGEISGAGELTRVLTKDLFFGMF